jgi:hypothetical protein
MNQREARKLASIQAPQHLLRQLIKEEDVYEEERDKMDKARRSGKFGKEMEDKMDKALGSETMYKKRQIIDPKIADEIEKIVDYRVKRAIRRGDIPDPKKDPKARQFLDKIKNNYR